MDKRVACNHCCGTVTHRRAATSSFSLDVGVERSATYQPDRSLVNFPCRCRAGTHAPPDK